MKELEKEYRTYLPSNSYAVIRVDGKGFSKYTRDMEKPFDWGFTTAMRLTAKYLAEQVEGAHLAYTQSDEISVIFSDLAGENTEWWYGGQVQKLVSVTAAYASVMFNRLMNQKIAVFDARVHHLDGAEGVLEYLKWRQDDAVKNSVGMLASHHISHKKLLGVPTIERIRLLNEMDVNWYDLHPAFTMGSLVGRELRPKQTTFVQNGVEKTVDFERKEWVIDSAPKFDSTERLGL